MRALGSLALLLVLLSHPARPASACLACSHANLCEFVGPAGNYLCSGNGFSCSQGWPCRVPFQWAELGASPTALSITLHPIERDDPSFAKRPGPRHAWFGKGALDAESARRVLAAQLTDPAAATAAAGVEFVVATSGFAARLEDGRGGVLSVAAGGGGDRVRARVASGAAPGEGATACELLGAEEVLVTRARLGGREWWVVAQVTPLPLDPEACRTRMRELQEALFADPTATRSRTAPPLEVKLEQP